MSYNAIGSLIQSDDAHLTTSFPRRITLVARNAFRNHFIDMIKAFAFCLTSRSSLDLNGIALRVVAVCVTLCASFMTCAEASAQSTHPCLSPSAIALTQRLNAPCEQTIAETALIDVMREKAIEFELSIWIDRRVAIDTPIRIETPTKTLYEFLAKSTEAANASLAQMDNMVVIVPSTERDAIERTYWQLVIAKPPIKWVDTERTNLHWSEASVPGDIIAKFIERNRLQLASPATIEHDLWPEWSFNRTHPAAVCVCLLSGFGLQLDPSDTPMRVGDYANEPVDTLVSWTYDAATQKRIGPQASKAWREHWPNSQVKKLSDGTGWEITATVAAHRELVASLVPVKKWEPPKQGRKVYTGQLRGTLGNVIATLANQMKLEFTPLPLPDKEAKTEVDLKFTNATVDEILQLLAPQTNYRFQRSGQKVQIMPSL